VNQVSATPRANHWTVLPTICCSTLFLRLSSSVISIPLSLATANERSGRPIELDAPSSRVRPWRNTAVLCRSDQQEKS